MLQHLHYFRNESNLNNLQRLGGGRATKSKRSRAPKPVAETITPYAKALRTLENTLKSIKTMVNLNPQDERLLSPQTRITTEQKEALLYLQRYQDPEDLKELNPKILMEQELEELIKQIPTQIDMIRMALEEERSGEMDRINNTLQGILDRSIQSLKSLSSEKVVELISLLKEFSAKIE
ncbi:MAG: hypothetical protein ACK551_01475 [Vampirovibrionales bacterium]